MPILRWKYNIDIGKIIQKGETMKKIRAKQKGVSVVVSHAAFLAIGVMALIIISSMVWNVYDSVVKEEIRKDLSKISQTAAGEIVKLYSLKDSPASPNANTSILLGESSMNLQQKAGGRQYSIELLQSGQIQITGISGSNSTKYATQIRAYTTAPPVQVNYTIYNIESRVQGSGFGDKPLTLKYFRLNSNGTLEDRIVLNDALVIAGESIG